VQLFAFPPSCQVRILPVAAMQQSGRRPQMGAVAVAVLVAFAAVPLSRGTREDRATASRKALQANPGIGGAAASRGSLVEVNGEATEQGALASTLQEGDVLMGRFKILELLAVRPLQGSALHDFSGPTHAKPHALLEAQRERYAPGTLAGALPVDQATLDAYETRYFTGALLVVEFKVELTEDVGELETGTPVVIKFISWSTPDKFVTPNKGQKKSRAIELLDTDCGEAMDIQKFANSMGDDRYRSRFGICYGTNTATAKGDEPFYSLFSFSGGESLFKFSLHPDLSGKAEDLGEDALDARARQVLGLMKQLLEGLLVLSSMNPPRVHGDLHLETVVAEVDAESVWLHISDYFFMKEATPEMLTSPAERPGTGSTNNVPPEALRNTEYKTATAFDSYSVGGMTLAMATGADTDKLVAELYKMLKAWLPILHTDEVSELRPDFIAEFKQEFVDVDFTDSADFEESKHSEELQAGIFFPIHPKSEKKVFTPHWWLKFAAAIVFHNNRKPFFPVFARLWSNFGNFNTVLESLLHDDPEKRPTPQVLLQEEIFSSPDSAQDLGAAELPVPTSQNS